MAQEAEIRHLLAQIQDPHTGKDIISQGYIQGIQIDGSVVSIKLAVPPPASPERSKMKENIRKTILTAEGVERVELLMVAAQPQPGQQQARRPGLNLNMKNIIPVASGKGGVGKSTVSANLAIALAQSGAKVGLMDADVYGPSIPTLLGVTEKPMQEGNKLIPPVAFGVKLISMGFFLPKNDAVIWRGPMLHKMIDQFLGTVEWGELDYLIIDLPPGTGDIQLSLCQSIPLTGAVIVSTPQDLAFHIAEKAIIMFQKLKTSILGLVENMSGHVCSHCGKHDDIFGQGGAARYGQANNVPFLGSIPLSKNICTHSDAGTPIVVADPDSDEAKAFFQIATALKQELAGKSGKASEGPATKEITIEDQKEVRILWEDDSECRYNPLELRLACACAQCQDEMTGKRLIQPDSVPASVHPTRIDYVGQYAIRISWSDGHSSGIYSFEYLWNLRPQNAN